MSITYMMHAEADTEEHLDAAAPSKAPIYPVLRASDSGLERAASTESVSGLDNFEDVLVRCLCRYAFNAVARIWPCWLLLTAREH